MTGPRAAFILSWFVAAAVAAQTPRPASPSAAAIAAHIEQDLRAARVPGAGIAVVAGNDVHVSGFGVADVERGTPMTPKTLAQVGSLTKLVTALAVTATLEEQRVDVDSAMGKHMPGLSPRVAAATFHQLLAQTSGLRDTGSSGDHDEQALAQSVRQITAADFVLPAGTVFSYSNLGYAVAGAALEQMRKKPFADALHDAVLGPLGMTTSTMRLTVAMSRPYATGHRLEASRLTAVKPPGYDTRIGPAGDLWSNAIDMSRLLQALMQRGRVENVQRLPSAAVVRVTTAHTEMPNVFPGGHYGYGLMLARDRGVAIYEHGGTMPGASSIVRIAPDERIGVAILSNLDNAPLRRIAQAAMASALGLPALRPAPRTETAVTAEEMKPYIGVYRNRGSAELAVRDGRVVLILDEGPVFAVTRIGANRFLGRPKPDAAGPEFVLQPVAGSAPAYLHFALWAYTQRPD